MRFHAAMVVGAAIFCASFGSASELSVEELEVKLETVTKEESRAGLELQATEGVIREREAELMRLTILEGTLKIQLEGMAGTSGAPSDPNGAGSNSQAASPDLSPELEKLRQNLTKQAADKVALIRSADGIVGMAFAFQAKDGIRIFTPAALISDNPAFSIETIAGERLEMEPEISCPTGVELIGLHPKQQLAPFQLTEEGLAPSLGDPILVISYSRESKEISGTTGRIRGIGPDVWELDAALTPDMIGSPVISLKSEKVIGIVAPQVEGVETYWARGTRHEGARNFAARLDRIQDWQAINLDRFKKESFHVRKFEQVTHIVWVGHTLISQGSQEMKEYAEAESEANGKNPLIQEAKRWKAGSGPSRVRDKGILYRNMLNSLRVKDDLSGKFGWYHERRYQLARQARQDAIRFVSGEIHKLER